MDKIFAYDSWGVQIGYTYLVDEVDAETEELKEENEHLTEIINTQVKTLQAYAIREMLNEYKAARPYNAGMIRWIQNYLDKFEG